MIFIKVNTRPPVGFSLDQVAKMEEIDGLTIITLTNGEQVEIPVSLNEYCEEVFDTENMMDEYNLVEFDDERPESTDEEPPSFRDLAGE